MRKEEIREYFFSVKESEKVSHAYIIEEESGQEAEVLAGDFAALLECEKGTGCGTCHSCLAYASGNHPDIIRVSHEKPDSIGVEEIRRQLVDDITIRPYSSPYKVYLVPEAEKLTVQAQNALLKTLEEPPYYGMIFLLTSNAGKLLPTILSRSVLLKLTEEEQEELLLPEEDRNLFLSLLRQARQLTVAQMADGVKTLKERKIPAGAAAVLARVYVRDVLVLQSTGKTELLRMREELDGYREWAEEVSPHALYRILEEIDAMESRILSNVNYELAVELLLLTMKTTKKLGEHSGVVQEDF